MLAIHVQRQPFEEAAASPESGALTQEASLLKCGPIAIVAVLAIFCCGCTTTIENDFHGEARNINSDNQTVTLRCDIPGYCDGPSAQGGHFVGFEFPAEQFYLFLFYPKTVPGRSFIGSTEPPESDAWLIRGNDYDWCNFVESGELDELRRHGGQRLRGRVAVRWKDNADFNIVINLAATNGDTTSLNGEFAGYTRTKFDPGVVLAGLYMVFYGDGDSSTPKQTIAPKDDEGAGVNPH